MKKLMIGVLSIGLSYGMKSVLTKDTQQLWHLQETQKESKHNGNSEDAGYCSFNPDCNDRSDSYQCFEHNESGFRLHGFEPAENPVRLPVFEEGESNFLLSYFERGENYIPFRHENWELNVSDGMYGEAEPLQKSRIEVAPQEPQEEEFFSSTSKRLVRINLDNAEQEVREAITNSRSYDLERIAEKHNVLIVSLRARLYRNRLIKKMPLSRMASQRRLFKALSAIKALRDANKSVVLARIAKKFRVNASSLTVYCRRNQMTQLKNKTIK